MASVLLKNYCEKQAIVIIFYSGVCMVNVSTTQIFQMLLMGIGHHGKTGPNAVVHVVLVLLTWKDCATAQRI